MCSRHFMLEGQDFQNSLGALCYFFQIEQIHEEQLQCIKAFFSGKDVYLSAMTGYGKFLCTRVYHFYMTY